MSASQAARHPAGYPVAALWHRWALDYGWTVYIGPAPEAWSPEGDPVHWIEAAA